MPELPDITVYIEALRRRIVGEPVEEVRVNTPFLLRTVDPPLDALIGSVFGPYRDPENASSSSSTTSYSSFSI